jgi:hypothetical protein
VTAPDPQQPPPASADAYADLVVEGLPRSANPPAPSDLDNSVLRGRATPAGYVPSTAAVPQLMVPIGHELALTTDIPFTA